MILSELIQRAIDIASNSTDTAVTRLALEAAAEAELSIAFQEVSAVVASSVATRSLLRRTKSLSFVNGAVTVDSDVLTEYISEGNITDPTDKTKRYSLTPWNQFITDELDSRLGHFSIEGESTLHVIEPGTAYDPASGPTETLLLTVPCFVVVPAAISDPVLVRDEVLDNLIKALAVRLRPGA